MQHSKLVRQTVRLPIVLLTLSIIAGGLQAHPKRYDPDGEYYFTFRDAPRSLELKSDEIWVKARAGSTVSDEEIRTQVPGWARSLTRGQWVLFKGPNASAPPRPASIEPLPPRRIRGAINRLIDTLQNTLWVSPAFLDPDGYELTFPPQLVVRLRPGIADEDAQRFFRRTGFQ